MLGLISDDQHLSLEHLEDLESLDGYSVMIDGHSIKVPVFDKRSNGGAFSFVIAFEVLQDNRFDLQISQNILLLLPVDQNKTELQARYLLNQLPTNMLVLFHHKHLTEVQHVLL